jgi:hypothetical protein
VIYAEKREFAARVFAAVLIQWGSAGLKDSVIISLLAQAQLDALPPAWEAEGDAISFEGGDADERLDAAYALAVQLSPLIGVEVQDGKS